MTNREWLLNKMQNMSDEELAKILNNSTCICVLINKTCEECGGNDCIKGTIKWFNEEHKEKITISEAERIILENIDKEYKWIARDEDDEIRVFNKKPEEDVDCRIWICGTGEKNARLSAINHLFRFITWEDSEPYNIEELLKQ